MTERPPLDLMVSIASPDGPSFRWGADDPSTQNVPDALAFTTTAPGGFEQCNLQLERDPRIDWPDTQEYADVKVVGLGGAMSAWEGRLEDLPNDGGQSSNLQPQMYGYQAHLQDRTDAAMIYIDSLLGNWGSPSPARQAELVSGNTRLGSSALAVDPAGNPAIVQTISNAWATPIRPLCEAWYAAPAGCLIAKIYYAVTFGANVNPADANWGEHLGVASDGVATIYEETANLLAPGTVSGLFAPATAYAFAWLQHVYVTTPAGGTLDYQTFWGSVQVIGNHGLPLQGSGPYGLLASDMIADAVSRWAPLLKFTTGAGGTIEPSTLAITQALYAPSSGQASTAASIIQDLVRYELLDWAVWENRTFYLNARGARGRTWRTRIGECQLQATGPQASNMFNGVVVSWTASDGTAVTVGPPGANTNTTDSRLADPDPANPVNAAGLTKWFPLSSGATTLTEAVAAGVAYLQTLNVADTSGQASLVGHVQDAATGTWWPAWLVRGGDTLIIADAADTSGRRVVSTSYDDPSKTNTVQLDQPPATLQAMLARIAAGMTP